MAAYGRWSLTRSGGKKRVDCSVAVKRKLDLNSAGECDIKEKHKVKRKRLPEASRPVLQRQHGVVENIGEKFPFFQRDLDSQTDRET